MKRLAIVVAMFVFVCSAYAAIPRIAIMSLENKSGFRGTEMDLGTGMADMLTTEFVTTKKVRVVERAEMEKIMKEQNFDMSGAVNAQTAAKIGQILGVEYMIIGSVNEFGTSKSAYGAFGVSMVNNVANVGLDIRAIDTSSAEIIAAATGKGSKSKKGVGISNAAIFPTNVVMGSAEFSSSLIGQASREAVQDAVSKIIGSIGGSWKGVVIKVSPDNKVTINGGENAGIVLGDVFQIVRKGEEMKDPETGETLGTEETVLGEIKITDIKPKYSIGDIISGTGMQAGDKVQKKQEAKKKG